MVEDILVENVIVRNIFRSKLCFIEHVCGRNFFSNIFFVKKYFVIDNFFGQIISRSNKCEVRLLVDKRLDLKIFDRNVLVEIFF